MPRHKDGYDPDFRKGAVGSCKRHTSLSPMWPVTSGSTRGLRVRGPPDWPWPSSSWRGGSGPLAERQRSATIMIGGFGHGRPEPPITVKLGKATRRRTPANAAPSPWHGSAPGY